MKIRVSKKHINKTSGDSLKNSNKLRSIPFLKMKAAEVKLKKSMSKSLIPKRILNEGTFRIA